MSGEMDGRTWGGMPAPREADMKGDDSDGDVRDDGDGRVERQ